MGSSGLGGATHMGDGQELQVRDSHGAGVGRGGCYLWLWGHVTNNQGVHTAPICSPRGTNLGCYQTTLPGGPGEELLCVSASPWDPRHPQAVVAGLLSPSLCLVLFCLC